MKRKGGTGRKGKNPGEGLSLLTLLALAASRFPSLRLLGYSQSFSSISLGDSGLEGSIYGSWTCLVPSCPECLCLVLDVPEVTLSIQFPDS